jgi:hypothetical protein
MTYWEETIAADANPGPLVYTALATKLLALGWTLEDTVVIGARTHKVLKSAAVGNTYNLDWFLDISYPTTGVASGLLLCPFEGYTAASDVALRGPYTGSNTTLDASTYSRFGATTLSLESWSGNSAAATSLDTPLSTAAFVIYASVTRDRVILLSSTEPSQASYAGFFTPTAAHAAHAGAAMFPLVMTRLSGAVDRVSTSAESTLAAAVTRVPKLASINWSNCCIVGPASMRMNGRIGGAASGGDNQVTTVPFLVGIGGAGWASATVAQVGELSGVQVGWADATVARGDVVTIGGVAHTLSTVSANAAICIAQV